MPMRIDGIIMAAVEPGDGRGLILGVLALGVLVALAWLWVRWLAHRARTEALESEWPEGTKLAARREWVRKRVEVWWAAANRVHGARVEECPRVEFSARLKSALGWADGRRNLIKISDHHLMEKPKRVADETVAHEVAHIFADRHYGKLCRHGKLWKQTMVAMGQKPDVYYIDLPEEEPEPEEAAAA